MQFLRRARGDYDVAMVGFYTQLLELGNFWGPLLYWEQARHLSSISAVLTGTTHPSIMNRAMTTSSARVARPSCATSTWPGTTR